MYHKSKTISKIKKPKSAATLKQKYISNLEDQIVVIYRQLISNKVQNFFAKEIHVLWGNNLFDFANTFTALNPGWRVLPRCAYIQGYGLLTSVGILI